MCHATLAEIKIFLLLPSNKALFKCGHVFIYLKNITTPNFHELKVPINDLNIRLQIFC